MSKNDQIRHRMIENSTEVIYFIQDIPYDGNTSNANTSQII
jgi:hypothetical protein